MNKVRAYIQESVSEMRHKVTWPKYSHLQSSSILVLVASIIFALLIGAMDLVFDKGMALFYESF